jgi:thioredoxin-dependent peroxiredoxin
MRDQIAHGGDRPASGPASRPAVGQPAPDFTLPGPGGAPVSLSELLRGGPVVLYFYPKDQTPGCTMEACGFRDAIDAFAAAGAQVVGISRDDETSHARFAAKHKLPFLLLSDTTGEIHTRYGVTKKLGLIPDRMTFVIDRDGIVQLAFQSMIRMRAHVDESLAIVRRLRETAGNRE